MTDQHPIIPSQELIGQWTAKINSLNLKEQLIMVAQWGANQELEACCEWFQEFYKTESWVRHDLKHLRTARRPKPPSLKEQALAVLDDVSNQLDAAHENALRRALEALPND